MAENPPKVGSFLKAGEKKDAIHVAVIPVTTNNVFKPGTAVSVYYDIALKQFVVNTTGKKVGVIDPFLNRPTRYGDIVYLFLYPNTVKNLRHDWEHPDLVEPEEPAFEPENPNSNWFGDYEERCPC